MTEIGNLLTPVQFAKTINVPPQQIYALIKRGLPTHTRILKDKSRELVDPVETIAWMADYEQVKGIRKSAEKVVASNEILAPGSPVAAAAGKGQRNPVGYIKPGQLLTYERMPGNIVVGKVNKVNEHYAEVEKNCYERSFILGNTVKRTFPLTAKHVKEYIRNRSMVLDCPLQVLGYVIEQIEHADPAMADDLRAVLMKYEPVVEPVIIDPVDEYLQEVDDDDIPEAEEVEEDEHEDTDADRAAQS